MARAHDARQSLDDEIPLFLGNPTLRVSPALRGLPSTDSPVEGSVGLFAPVDFAGRGFAERASAAESRAALLEERAQATLEAKLEATEAYLSAWGVRRAFQLAREELALAEELAASIERAASSKAVSSADAARARRYASEIRLDVRRLEGEVFERDTALAKLVGCSATDAPLEAPPPPPDHGSTDIGLAAAHPGVRAKERALAAEKTHGEALLRGALGRLELGVVAEKDGPKDYRGMLEVQIPIPVFDRAQKDRSRSAADAARLEGEREEALREARTQLQRAEHEVEHSTEVLEIARQTLLPAAEEAERLEKIAFEAGASTLVELLRARSERLDAARSLVAAETDHAVARWQLALLIQALEGDSPSDGDSRS